jgi:RIO-like serine/threonine protein kinase
MLREIKMKNIDKSCFYLSINPYDNNKISSIIQGGFFVIPESSGLNHNELIQEINKIKVTKPLTREAIVHNPTDLSVIKNEKSRAVIGIDATHCAVFYTDEIKAEKEYEALQSAAKIGIAPQVFGRKGTYVVMEPIHAPTLADYLTNGSITLDLTKQLLQLLHDFEKIGFTRSDQKPEYIYMMPDNSLKVVNLYRHNRLPAKTLPKRIMRGMGSQLALFLQYVKKLELDTYRRWRKHPDFNSVLLKAKEASKLKGST